MPNLLLSEQSISVQRPVLYRYALLQLGDNALAEDAVQETLLAALQSAANFEGKAELRSWLIGILKHKIADHWRLANRECLPLSSDGNMEDEADVIEDDFFTGAGHWNSDLKTWANPEAALKQQEFWAVYEFCQNNLPQKMAKVFMLRELVGLSAEEICRETGLSESSYWVTMHRARLRLRECLAIRWFDNDKRDYSYA